MIEKVNRQTREQIATWGLLAGAELREDLPTRFCMPGAPLAVPLEVAHDGFGEG